jgi:c-di-GMP-binding flagellar brake protein YcgR
MYTDEHGHRGKHISKVFPRAAARASLRGPMNEAKLEVNDLVQVAVSGGQFTSRLATRVEDAGEREIVVAWPAGGQGLVSVTASQPVCIFFVRQGKVWMIEGFVRETRKSPVPVWVVQPTAPPRSVERRDDLRVHSPVHVCLREKVISLSSYRDSRGITSFEAFTADISAGGFTVRHEVPLEIGTIFDAALYLPDRADPLNLDAKVIRCDARPEGARTGFEIALAFVHIAESTRARLVRFVFKAQIDEFESEV